MRATAARPDRCADGSAAACAAASPVRQGAYLLPERILSYSGALSFS